MAAILFAWELGGGYGHAFRMAEVARRLAAQGHQIAVATQSLDLVRHIFAGITTAIEPAPMPSPSAATHFADSYAEVLLRCGFDDPVTLENRVEVWLAILARHRPQLIITDFAPTAMLASSIAGIPVAAVENGYTLPPPQNPLPSTQAWQIADPARLQALDDAVVRVTNACLAARGQPGLVSLAGLFRGATPFLCTLPELDHYVDRANGDFYGPIYAQSTGEAPEWPAGPGPRVFAYLDPAHPVFGPMLDALVQLGWPTVLHCRGGGGMDRQNNSVRVHAATVQFSRALAECDFVICQGLATVSAALLAGRPIVQVPDQLEQMMTLHQVVRLGLGAGVLAGANTGSAVTALELLRTDAGYAHRATQFARRYHGFTSGLAADAVAEGCAALC